MFFSSSSLSAIRVVSSAYLRLLIFLLAILILTCAPSSLACSHDVLCIEVKRAGWQYTASAYSFLNLEPVCCSMSGSNCCFLTWIQISQESGKVLWYFHLLKNFPQFVGIHTDNSLGVVNKAEVDIYLINNRLVWKVVSGGFDQCLSEICKRSRSQKLQRKIRH